MNAPNSNPVLDLNAVGICYRRKGFLRSADYYWALTDISFKVFRGETLGVLGRNGAGKSTLLRTLAGIITPDKGTINFEKGLKASLLSLQVGFSAHLTGRQNIVMSGILLGLKRQAVLQLMDTIIDFSDLGEFIDQPIRTYSSGMRARLGFAIAAYANPDIILIDEVLGVGDAEFKRKSANLIREKISSNKTVVLVSHSAATIENLCDRAVWIDGGRIRSEGKASEVLKQYEAS